MSAFAQLRRLAAGIRAERAARRTYQALCDQGRAPLVSIEIRLITDRGDDWDGGVPGIHGVSTTVPLTRDGERYIAGIPRTIRRSCIRQIRADQTHEKGN